MTYDLPAGAKPIPDCDGYAIESDGTVWSQWRPFGKRSPSWAVMKPWIANTGYPTIWLKHTGEKRTKHLVHRIVLEVFVGPCPPGMECCHEDGNRLNARLGNLRWDTSSSNKADRVKHGTGNAGEKHPNAKLTELQVMKIAKRCAAGGESQRSIARDFGISEAMVRHIRNGRRWSSATKKASM